MANASTIEIAQEVREDLASSSLTAGQAKLYSQCLRRDMGRDGLASFSVNDVILQLDHAMLLLSCSMLERKNSATGDWRSGVKRAAEILEWLCQPSLKPTGAPLELLAAAAYQLAEFPAMALGILKRVPNSETSSVILREYLRADFPATLEAIREFWRVQRALRMSDKLDMQDITSHTFQHIVMCLGTICVYLRTGDDTMAQRAILKLDRLAASSLHSRDHYSYLLATLTAAVSQRFVDSCFWPKLQQLQDASTEAARQALIQFVRSAFRNSRALVWPAQAAGIESLCTETSFVLCTPTGSGKTTVATLAVIQNLFADRPVPAEEPGEGAQGNLVLYLVPSRALAAEVEARCAQDLSGITADPIVVTGLYGGIDWGPTDAWIQTDRATILICTFEKAEALIRYLGILFLSRVRLAVIDEAHMVEQDRSRVDGLLDGSSRAYRLEQLGARLLRASDEHGFKIIALSAVASRAAPALARWIGGSPDSKPTTSSYRSTRQMLGRLEINAAGHFEIHYELMDGRSLRFEENRQSSTPYVPTPFPPVPGGLSATDGPEVKMRAPTLWAALQLASQRPDGSTPSVLISLTQKIEDFAVACADLMDEWPADALPNYRAADEADPLWQRCLASAADYFSTESIEYRLLSHGIAMHHGKMPGLLARRLKAVIDRGFVRVVIATSTLSEGVNIPVSYLLLPSVYRSTSPLGLQEFTNLIGRAGRPGVSTEGSALVVLPQKVIQRGKRQQTNHGRQWSGYESLVKALEEATTAAGAGVPEDAASSPLSRLLNSLEEAWSALTGGGSTEEFATWLEQTAIGNEDELDTAYQYLDSLDTFLLAAIHEVEELNGVELPTDQIEAELTAIWRRTYAFAAAQEQERLSSLWLARGRAITTLYPDAAQRRRMYRSSLSPRSASRLLERAEAIRTELQSGADYVNRTTEQKLEFVRALLARLSDVPSFRIASKLGLKKNFEDWPKLLRWWLAKTTLTSQPTPKQITTWYDFVSQNFIYRGAWGLGSVIGVLLDGTPGQPPVRALEIGDWPRSGLPWIAFWIKELITWGTLDPVAAFLLARGDAVDRPQAEHDAWAYYQSVPEGIAPNDILDPRTIRDWVEAKRPLRNQARAPENFNMLVELERPEGDYVAQQLIVLPLDAGEEIVWIDAAGYTVARSTKPSTWTENASRLEFELDVARSSIAARFYLPHSVE